MLEKMCSGKSLAIWC